MSTKNYTKQQIKQQMGPVNGMNRKEQKKAEKVVLILGGILTASTIVNIANLILLVNLVS